MKRKTKIEENKIYIKSISISNQDYSGDRPYIEYDNYSSTIPSKTDLYALQEQVHIMTQTIVNLQIELSRIKEALPDESKLFLELAEKENLEN